MNLKYLKPGHQCYCTNNSYHVLNTDYIPDRVLCTYKHYIIWFTIGFM